MKKIFITGATGFIGGRLAEMTHERDIPIVALVRTWSRAAGLARLPVQMVHGDVLDLDSLRRGMKDCDVVFHCAVENRVGGEIHRRISVEGTANVMQAALETGVQRVVHLSSAAVFGFRPEADVVIDEDTYRYSNDVYGDGKIDSEKAALSYHREHGLPVTVLRPTIVYGPFSFWSEYPVVALREGRMVLVDGGTGICNALYIDNLIEAMFLAARQDQAAGQVFHVSDAAPITWKDYIEAHARLLGDDYLPLPEMTTQEIMAAIREAAEAGMPPLPQSSLKQAFRLIRDQRTREVLRTIPVVDRSAKAGKAIAQTLVPAPIRHQLRQKLLSQNNTNGAPNGMVEPAPHPLLSEDEVKMYTTFDKVVFRIDKARRLLGYEPEIDFTEGMKRTAAWIEWARL